MVLNKYLGCFIKKTVPESNLNLEKDDEINIMTTINRHINSGTIFICLTRPLPSASYIKIQDCLRKSKYTFYDIDNLYEYYKRDDYINNHIYVTGTGVISYD